jgi:AcrR family transcriptional regulator
MGVPPLEPRGRPLRADAARNHEKVLSAARRLFGEHGVSAVSMSRVAEEAGVAKGTVFHRFGDRAGLARALLDGHERALQDEILRGEPPLGPGAPAPERLAAFLRALAELTDARRELLLEVDGSEPGARYRTGAYAAWALHVRVLLDELRPGRANDVLAHVLLAPLAADLVEHLRAYERRSLEDLTEAVLSVARPWVREPGADDEGVRP